MGAISIMRIGGGKAELGYWLGVPYWGQGYATEAVRALFAFASESLGLERLEARVLARNPASSMVLRKTGFVPAGRIVEACGQHSDPEPLDLFELELKRLRSDCVQP
jgi:ribosomal-protein-alanine N-acetyltransferase